MTPDFSQVPATLKRLPRWVCWSRMVVKGKPTKVPFQANAKNASTTDPNTWTGFKEVVAVAYDGNCDGIGFVLTEDDDIAGVDLDHCLIEGTREPAAWAAVIIEQFDSYTEISPSGTGVRIFFRGIKPGKRCKKNLDHGAAIEIYETGRYLTVTGDCIHGAEVEDRSEYIVSFYNETFPPNAPPDARDNQDVPDHPISDDEAKDAMFRCEHHENILKLWDGDIAMHGDDWSRADCALISHIGFFTRYDREATDRLFRRSRLYREKWERAGYRKSTMDFAFSGKTPAMGYNPPIVFQAGSGASLTKAEKGQVYPCYLKITGEEAFPIEGRHRRPILQAIASQEHNREYTARSSRLSLVELNQARCKPQCPKDEIDKVIAQVYNSAYTPTARCDLIQAADLCPAKDGLVPCPIFNIEQKRIEATAASLAEDEGRLTLSPIWVQRSNPPIYTLTVKGQLVQATKEDIAAWSKFKIKAFAIPGIDQFLEIPNAYYKDDDGKKKKLSEQKVWEKLVNEAMEGLIELPLPPPEASPEGIAWLGFLSYLKNSKFSESREDLKRGSIFIDSPGDGSKGRLLFKGPDLLAFLKLERQDMLAPGEFWAMMRRKGASHCVVRVGDTTIKVWTVPSDVLEPDEEMTEEIVSTVGMPRLDL